MYQIDNSTAAATVPASTSEGTPGFFTDGNPATGVAATIMPAEFMNMVMMEIINVLTAAGITPSKSDFTQLLTAIKSVNRQGVTLTDTGSANAYAAANAPALTVLPATGYSQRVNIAHANTGASTYASDGLAAKPVYGLGLQPLQGGELPVGVAVLMYLVQAGVNGGNGAWIIIESLGGASQIAPATKSQHAVTLGQLQNWGSQMFSANGTFNVPAGITMVYVTLCGSGGGGAAYFDVSSAGGGGGGGASGLRVPVAVTPLTAITVTVGVAGTGGQSAGAAGVAGGASSFGALLSAPGGAGGTAAGIGGSGGSGSGSIVAGGIGQAYNPSASSAEQGGSGGGSAFGSGGFGGMRGGTVAPTSGGGFGGGGGGGCRAVGAPGSKGFVLVEWNQQ
ncbi:hypothetical protein PS870_00923 [Pseudomonas fluorescens]|uniref:Glycine-rich domain-containing protein n=1 Tax=Pseudomonas fluorescens TaxID=294 RepID=A0A5E7HHH3_PSEFL|nr:hypothetical protein [Pseudomonas fluorescens]VVO63614.1 hypothetical protein PS870_00923 [Pseudomonas fluorescens]